jgi:hypothetical protein
VSCSSLGGSIVSWPKSHILRQSNEKGREAGRNRASQDNQCSFYRQVTPNPMCELLGNPFFVFFAVQPFGVLTVPNSPEPCLLSQWRQYRTLRAGEREATPHICSMHPRALLGKHLCNSNGGCSYSATALGIAGMPELVTPIVRSKMAHELSGPTLRHKP